jgi:hypothetical protein
MTNQKTKNKLSIEIKHHQSNIQEVEELKLNDNQGPLNDQGSN